MSAFLEVEETGTMWESEDDILTDLAFLNDFRISGDTQPQRILYSNGRGSKLKQKRKTDENLFIDPRTGEPIDIDTTELSSDDFMYKGKGRGRHLGSSLVNKFQLLEQLRLARPLGSGDEAIESYCRRNIPKETSTSESQNIEAVDKNSVSDLKKPMLGIRGSRNSARQSNVLISGLLSKAIENTNAGLISNKEQFSDIEDDNSNDSACSREKNKHNNILNGFGENDEEEGKRQGGSKDGGRIAVIHKFNASTDLYDFERESVTSDESGASFSTFSEDFPALRPCFKKKFF